MDVIRLLGDAFLSGAVVGLLVVAVLGVVGCLMT